MPRTVWNKATDNEDQRPAKSPKKLVGNLRKSASQFRRERNGRWKITGNFVFDYFIVSIINGPCFLWEDCVCFYSFFSEKNTDIL